MEKACKWSTIAVLWVVFFTLVALAGCINIIEFMASMAVGIIVARWFYRNLCTRLAYRLANGTQPPGHRDPLSGTHLDLPNV